jgi:hypothetical protein
MPDPIDTTDECKSIGEFILYKVDRTLAILGVIAIAMLALWLAKGPDSMNIATAAIGGLVGYVGGRSGK